MICCDELPSGVLSLYHYFNIVTIISSYAGEDESLIKWIGKNILQNNKFQRAM